MSRVGYLEKLLDGVDVEWVVLGDERFVEIANSARRPVKASLRSSGEIPYFGANNIQDYVEGYTHDGDYVLIAEDGSASLENYSIQYATGKFWANNHVHVLRGKKGLNTKFLYHYLRIVDFLPYLPNKDRAKLTKGEMIKIPFPIPCPENPKESLAIQTEIVRILDAFAELTAKLIAELIAEIAARKKQYNHYRDQFLSFNEGEVEWKLLGELGDFTYGYAAKAQDSGDARFVRITDINSYGRLVSADSKYVDVSEESGKYLLKRGDLLMARTGATYGKTMIFEEDYPAVYAGFLIKLSLDKKFINPRFYWHFAQSKFFWDQANKLAAGGGQPQFNANALRQVKMPIPHPCDPEKSLAEQARIVELLDKFDALTNSICEGLPREIELRQKQYVYYRDLLLSFQKPEEVEA